MSKGWRKVALGDVLRIASVPEVVHPERRYPNLGIYGFGRGVFAKPDINGQDTCAKTLYRVAAGQFIYSRLFAFEGAYAVVPRNLDGAYVSNEFPTFDWNRTVADPRFVEWIFKRPLVWSAIAEMGVGMGDRRKRVHPDSLLSYCIKLPSLDAQRQIVERLDAVATRLTARAEAAERQEAELAAMLNASFAQMIVDAPRVPMTDVAPLVRRPITVTPDQSYDELGVRSFGKGTFHKPALSSLDLGNKRIFRIEPGDLIFSNVFAWEGAIAIARSEDTGRVGSHRFITCTVDRRRIAAEILRFFFLTKEGLGLIGQASPGGAGRNRTLGLEALGAIMVPIPSLDTQNWFNGLHTKVAALRAHQAAIAADADALLPAMLARIFG